MSDPRVADHLAICATKARYCRMLDTKDWEGFADVFTEGLVVDTTGSGGFRVAGRDAALRMIRAAIGDAITVHQVHAPEIEFLGEDAADAIWAMQDRVVWNAPRSGLLGLSGFGHYHERYLRCADGRWRIATQRLTRLHMDLQRAAES